MRKFDPFYGMGQYWVSESSPDSKLFLLILHIYDQIIFLLSCLKRFQCVILHFAIHIIVINRHWNEAPSLVIRASGLNIELKSYNYWFSCTKYRTWVHICSPFRCKEGWENHTTTFWIVRVLDKYKGKEHLYTIKDLTYSAGIGFCLYKKKTSSWF